MEILRKWEGNSGNMIVGADYVYKIKAKWAGEVTNHLSNHLKVLSMLLSNCDVPLFRERS